ncbi:MAG TPA: DoxX family protein [Tepidisphaeraceae bacterium]|jgi:uncharacterized membrane protein YphA (DoxX/SURF4 family)
MSNPFNHPAWIDISLFLARLTLGLYMLLAGWEKISAGVGTFISDNFMKLKPAWLPEMVAYPYAYALPFAELLTGLLLLLGLFTRISAGLIALMLLSIYIAQASKFGITGLEKAGPPFQHSIVMFTMAFMIAIIGSGRLALDPLYSGGGDSGGGRKK